MFIVIGVMALGIMTGFLCRKRPFKNIGKFITVLIWVLLFLLGIEVGGDERIVKGLADLGAEALLISAAGVLGSSLLALLLWRVLDRKLKGREK